MSTASDESHGFLDNAKVRHGGSFHDSLVDDVKALLKVMCVLFTFIPYWIVYMQVKDHRTIYYVISFSFILKNNQQIIWNISKFSHFVLQMETTFPIQGLHMRLKLFLNQSTAEHEHVFKVSKIIFINFVLVIIMHKRLCEGSSCWRADSVMDFHTLGFTTLRIWKTFYLASLLNIISTA